MPETLLSAPGVLRFPAGSARGLTVDVERIEAGELRRTVNGDAVWTGRATHRRYRLRVSCTDQGTPTLAGLWPGQTLQVDWPVVVRQVVTPSASTVELVRDAVVGTVAGYGSGETPVALSSLSGRTATFAAAVLWVEFRPTMDMVVVELSEQHDEWGATAGWSLTLEEA